ncbi:unnamed protein product [Brassica rapa subsp. trilocularis]
MSTANREKFNPKSICLPQLTRAENLQYYNRSQPNRQYERDEVLVVVHADHTYELFSQPISQAQTISPSQHTSRSRRNAEEADSGDCGEKIGGLEEDRQWRS